MLDNILGADLLKDLPSLDKRLRENWETYMTSGKTSIHLRNVITCSWERCRKLGVDPCKNKEVPTLFIGNSLLEILDRNKFLIENAAPVIQDLINLNSTDALTVALTNGDGILINREASPSISSLIKSRYPLGTDWTEESAGTNTIGITLHEKKPIQVFAAEHYCKGWHSFFGTAAPIRDPFTKELIGTLTLTRLKSSIDRQDIFTVVNRTQLIEQIMSTKFIDTYFSETNYLFHSSQTPFVIFNTGGTITYINQAVYRMFEDMKLGDSILEYIGPSSISSVNELNYYSREGVEWKIKLKPYKIEENLFGGMASFHRITPVHTVPLKPKGNSTRYEFHNIITQEDSMKHVIELSKKAAFIGKTILITGETGTGKELIAQSIHAYGPRKNKPFIGVNCGAIPKELVASELFGYESGAFTGANAKGKKGKFQLADQGTIFLDEVGDLPLDIQVYLLRVLEERTIFPIGGSKPFPINVHVIAATHKDLKKEITEGRFREDLYYRLTIINLFIPPLRDRVKDIRLLAKYFLEKSETHRILSSDVLKILESYSWPGNIRQLKNAIEQIASFSKNTHIERTDLPKELLIGSELIKKENSPKSLDMNYVRKKINKNEVSHDALMEVLRRANGNISKTADMLNISRMTVYRKIKKMEEEGQVIFGI